jgi:hypothetical protein
MRTLVGISGFFVAVPVLLGWAKWRYWVWLEERGL